MRNSWKVIVLVILVIFVVAIASLKLLNGRPPLVQDTTQSSNPLNAEWKSYSSERYGYSVKFPESWIVKSTIGGSGKTFEDVTIHNPSESKSGIEIQNVEGYSEDKSPLERVKNYLSIYQDNAVVQWNFTTPVTTTLGTSSAITTDLTATLNGKPKNTSRLIFISNARGLFEISFPLNQSSSDLNVIKMMLTTFNFPG